MNTKYTKKNIPPTPAHRKHNKYKDAITGKYVRTDTSCATYADRFIIVTIVVLVLFMLSTCTGSEPESKSDEVKSEILHEIHQHNLNHSTTCEGG